MANESTCIFCYLRDRSLFITEGEWVGGGGENILGGISWFLGEQKGGSVVTENPQGGITENFGRIQRGGTIKSSPQILPPDDK